MTETTDTMFTGKVALVTGAGSGIGRAAALAFARSGAAVALAGRRPEPLAAVAGEIASFGGRALPVPVDVGDPGAVEVLIGGVVDALGSLDVAFNNAGVTGAFAPLVDSAVEDFDAVIATNLRGTWLLMKHELRAMQAHGRGGAIVNTSSIAATGGTAGLSSYAASKGALDALIRPVALEAGPHGIRVNNVSPGVTAGTGMSEALPAEYRTAIGQHAALKRLATPGDIAAAALWLASDAAAYVTGQSILVDGGFNIPGQR